MILGILQARMSSARLPGKVMKPILGEPMVAHQMDRLARCRMIDRLVLATSDADSDAPLAALAAQRGWRCFRGNLDDVLSRYVGANLAFGPGDHVVRSTADCPLIDSDIVDQTIALHVARHADYTSNALPGQRTFPDGLDVEVMTRAALERADAEAGKQSHREHVTPYILENPHLFKLAGLTQSRDLGELRWTVDTQRDFDFATAVFAELLPTSPHFGQDEILTLLARKPELALINAA
jgi:spore coat polysaccharide biosynthesis protein SpsF